jgi:hypothetical protein
MGLFADTKNVSPDISAAIYCNVKMTVSGNLPTKPGEATAPQANKGAKCGLGHVKSCATRPNLPKNSLNSQAATTNLFSSNARIQLTSHAPLLMAIPTSFLS